MSEPTVRWWQALTSPDVTALVARDPVVILPLAAIEQHGPHLPLSTDLDIGLGLVEEAWRRLPPDFPAAVLPPQAVGASAEHARFAGTLSLDAALLADLVVQIGGALAASGVRRLVLANSHGGNRHALDDAGLRLRAAHAMLVVKASWFRVAPPPGAELSEKEWRHGFHGGAVETAMMMHLRPDLVRTDALRDAPSLGAELEGRLRRLAPEGEAAFSWLAGDLNPTGVVGDPRGADAALGGRLIAHYGTALAEVIEDARAFPLDRLR